MTWSLIDAVPNPWGDVPVTNNGRSVVPLVEAYMGRVREKALERDCVSRRSHYVPKAYLRAWSWNGRQVRVLDTRNGHDKPRGLRATCVRENFYRVTDGNDIQHNQVEAMLAILDDEMARLLLLLRGWAPGDDLAFDDFMSLAVVVGMQSNRTPQARRFLASRSAWLTDRARQPPEQLTTDHYVDLLFRAMYRTANQLSTRQLELWDDPQGRFITCDHPVLLSQDAPGMPSALHSCHYVWWPISPTRLVVFSSEHQGIKIVHREASRGEIGQIRRTVIHSAESEIIALPTDRDLPAGKVLRKRLQLQVDCTQVEPTERKCRIGFGWGYGATLLDRACQPICALALTDDSAG
ncbi:hypothetical protein Atai01_78730 [Amycolatopsis taiwanensis]|uniref:DUF4238 domain-containing protein n=1 Tax=Amycolatopsis taiwanensis TaxID=342230 RepID=A0A9W6R8E9_9PSEU|nr:hypothetical protein Atai01_78730 [Amycolatopsis taiwanensis]